MDEGELKKYVLSGKKTDRVVFAASGEMKAALELVANEKCMSVSALLTQLATDEILANIELFKEVSR